ncbi:hypothetical protein INS49_006058 [Diaporthe citri]|uniref:uncharacterized protein n=1 Tax=Diaporthe citri TaxID=83186 RepID=UPI001C7F6EF4|nr:uncharacterized protein INS49_006058 [Diaporthe citri]KAG6364457.1 hypothetical protein INS49_006058 [Diaporthe citri]
MAQAISATERRPSVLQLLKRYHIITLPRQQLASMLPPIRPRQYSISSSPRALPTSLTITWSLITHATPAALPGQDPTPGLASHFLASLKAGDTLNCSVRPGQPRFSPPADPILTPTIMICAGAGLAPFRGFVQDRAERLRQNPDLASKVAPALLYIGCRAPEHALYAAELQGWQDSGAVDIRHAYSRQGARPDDHLGYVRDRVWADRDELVQIWEDGAKVYVCGSRAVSHGVRDVVQRIYREQAEERCESKTDAEVEGWWVEILRDRYAADVF